jgi:hypothetical protein
VSQYAEVAFALTGGVGLAPQRRAQEPLVPGEGALRLPALPVDPPVAALPGPAAEALPHLAAVAGLGPLPPPVAAVEGDHRGAGAKVLARQPVVLLAVEGGVGQAELRGVIGRAQADGGRGEEVAARVADGGELGPQARGVLAAGALEEVAGGVLALQAGGVEGRLGLVTDQAAFFCARGGLEEEQDKLPFFNSRCAA